MPVFLEERGDDCMTPKDKVDMIVIIYEHYSNHHHRHSAQIASVDSS